MSVGSDRAYIGAILYAVLLIILAPISWFSLRKGSVKPAQCMGCGETVLSLSRSFFQWSPTTECQACGKKVRKRGGCGELFPVFFVIGLIFCADSGSVDLKLWGGILVFAGILVFLFYMDYWLWRSVPWDIDEPKPTVP